MLDLVHHLHKAVLPESQSRDGFAGHAIHLGSYCFDNLSRLLRIWRLVTYLCSIELAVFISG
jgi:hypothetical protein